MIFKISKCFLVLQIIQIIFVFFIFFIMDNITILAQRFCWQKVWRILKVKRIFIFDWIIIRFLREILTIKFYLRFLFTIYDFTFELKFSFLIILVLALIVDLRFRLLIFNIFISAFFAVSCITWRTFLTEENFHFCNSFRFIWDFFKYVFVLHFHIIMTVLLSFFLN